MKKSLLFLFTVLLFIFACSGGLKKDSTDKWKSEIIQTEKDFSAMAQKEGIQKAFLAYAADDVVLSRNDSLIIGKEALKEFYEKRKPSPGKASLSWEPDFADVSSSGDIGYTYGRYVYTFTDSLGNSTSREGIFHTVWKRQPDGKWRFVWD